ncbi:DinB family protein [Croceitalea vernalis]|uniref:DinB family protein n=1 Tax=Croceitalea vernalis TaxID=3075599 RepID=A0ABU3BH07_9FLAO|nr:DinB family protein [Croceitalea sp. P007]MDT0621450.1 DinB family protein [Croceitalea sp. P007]
MENEAIKEFVENTMYRLDESSRMIAIAFESINEKQVWLRPNDSSNSIGNLILHLCGNITQYAISSLGGKEDVRNRDIEFETTSGFSKQELLIKLSDTIAHAKATIENATSEQWLKKREVQGFHFSGIGVILHVVEHYSYHTGQIAFWVKQLENKQLGFYDGLDLNIKNQ